MPSKISSNPHPDIADLVSSFKELKPSKKEEEDINECLRNFKQLVDLHSEATALNDSSLSHVETESFEDLKKKFIDMFSHIIELKKKASIHSQSESLLRLMHLMSSCTTLTTIATILAILIFLPVIQTVAVLLITVLANLLIILLINILLLKDESPILFDLKKEIDCSFLRLEALSNGVVEDDDDDDEDDENLDESISSTDESIPPRYSECDEHAETVENENTLSEPTHDTSSGSAVSAEAERNPDENVLPKSPSQKSLQGRSGLFLPLHAEAANNDNVPPSPAATSSPQFDSANNSHFRP